MAEQPKKKDVRYDEHGKIVCMAYADKYVMVRRPSCSPFVLHISEWDMLPKASA